MGRTVLLLHRLPDGSSHYDWLLELGPEGPLKTFRTLDRIDRPGLRSFRAEQIADHRREYLDYEGPISGGRGAVERVARGTVTASDSEAFSVEVDFGAGVRRWHGAPDPGDGDRGSRWWLFAAEGVESRRPAR